ncbi:MAG: 2-methylaconitate cis-trans isomerase PrpF family protein [Burkholderiales bacterium]
MKSSRYPAAFMRGGTSKALMFHLRDLPADRSRWDAIFLSAIGSPDPSGRQLNGMGGGVSSLSKVCVIGPPTQDDADVDYTFAQVLVKDARVDYSGNCGNMSSAVGPFAIDEKLVKSGDGDALVRIHNTNTKKIIHAAFRVEAGEAIEQGDLVIPGVAGSGAPIRLDFLDPGGATTGRLLPTGNVIDHLDVPGAGAIAISLIDAANATVFVSAETLGLRGTELPDAIEGDAALLERIAAIRAAGSVAMGITPDIAAARMKTMVPFFAIVAPPQAFRTLAGEDVPADAIDVTVRFISNGQPHRALPLTGSLCTAVAARLRGSVVQRAVRPGASGALRLGMPSGVLTVDASVHEEGGVWHATRGSFYRTARRLFDGYVYA